MTRHIFTEKLHIDAERMIEIYFPDFAYKAVCRVDRRNKRTRSSNFFSNNIDDPVPPGWKCVSRVGVELTAMKDRMNELRDKSMDDEGEKDSDKRNRKGRGSCRVRGINLPLLSQFDHLFTGCCCNHSIGTFVCKEGWRTSVQWVAVNRHPHPWKFGKGLICSGE